VILLIWNQRILKSSNLFVRIEKPTSDEQGEAEESEKPAEEPENAEEPHVAEEQEPEPVSCFSIHIS